MSAIVEASIKITPELHTRIKSLAETRNLPVHLLMIQAIEAYVNREEMREKWKREGVEAWAAYQETGLHLTNAEVLGWMDKIIDGESAKMPKCHI